MSPHQPSSLPRTTGWCILGLILTATVLNGLLAGGNVDRMLVATPAWDHVGLAPWADFSRHADLGRGLFVYPTLAFSGTLTATAAAVIFLYTTRSARGAAIPIILAAALMLAALPFSLAATPYMLSLRHIGLTDLASLETAYVGAHFWGRLQGIFHLAAFAANLWSIAAFCAGTRPDRTSLPSVPQIS